MNNMIFAPKDGTWLVLYYEEGKYEPTLGRWHPKSFTIGDQETLYEWQVLDKTARNVSTIDGSIWNWWPESRLEGWEHAHN